MENEIDHKTLLNFSRGKYSYNEYLKVKHWFLHIREDKKAEDQLFEQWKKTGGSATSGTASLHSLFEKIQYKILLEEKMNGKKRNLWQWYQKVAAILIPFIAVSALFYFLSKPGAVPGQSWVELSAPQGARIEFLLPDSTSGWLNSGAKLKYPPAFGAHRKVELTGEAFFKVSHREHSGFTVSVPDMNINVLGTQFNVSAYSNETGSEVVLKKGKVEVKGKTGAFIQTLLPGEKLTYNHESKSLRISKVDANLYTAWTKGYLVIDNESLAEAAKKLERWYNVEISIQDVALKSLRFKGTFNQEPLEEVLRFIAMTTPIVYKIERKGYDSNGILTKRQVTIKLR